MKLQHIASVLGLTVGLMSAGLSAAHAGVSLNIGNVNEVTLTQASSGVVTITNGYDSPVLGNQTEFGSGLYTNPTVFNTTTTITNLQALSQTATGASYGVSGGGTGTFLVTGVSQTNPSSGTQTLISGTFTGASFVFDPGSTTSGTLTYSGVTYTGGEWLIPVDGGVGDYFSSHITGISFNPTTPYGSGTGNDPIAFYENVVPTPEPASIAGFGIGAFGLLMLGLIAKRRKAGSF